MSGRLAGKIAMVCGAGSVAAGWRNGKATSVLFLASDESRYITGIELAVDGGLSASALSKPWRD